MGVCDRPTADTADVFGFYRARRTPDTDLYRLVDSHFDEFKRVYPRRYREDFGYWRPIIDDVVDEFLKCGDLEHGFARVRCPDCREEQFVTFSCDRLDGGSVAMVMDEPVSWELWRAGTTGRPGCRRSDRLMTRCPTVTR